METEDSYSGGGGCAFIAIAFAFLVMFILIVR